MCKPAWATGRVFFQREGDMEGYLVMLAFLPAAWLMLS